MDTLKRFQIKAREGHRVLLTEFELLPCDQSQKALAAYTRLKFPRLQIIIRNGEAWVGFKAGERSQVICLGIIPAKLYLKLQAIGDLSAIEAHATQICKRPDNSYCVKAAIYGDQASYDKLNNASSRASSDIADSPVSHPHSAQQPKHPNLMECEDCGRDVSVRARACPHCGCPILDAHEQSKIGTPVVTTQATSKRLKAHIVGAIILFVVSIYMPVSAGGIGEGKASVIWPLLMLVSIVWLFVARFRVWWHHK